MADENLSPLDHVHARVVALEFLMRGLLADMAISDGRPPAAFLEEFRNSTLASVQMVDREIGEYEDAIWVVVADELRKTFDQVRHRLEILGHG